MIVFYNLDRIITYSNKVLATKKIQMEVLFIPTTIRAGE